MDLTFTTRPLTGGIVSFWPGRSLIDVSLLAQKMVALSTLYFLLRLASVSPDLTLCLRSRSLPSGTVVSTDTGLSSVPSSRNGPLIASSRAAGAYVTGLTSRNSGVTGTSACSGPVDFCSTPKAPPTARRGADPFPEGPPTGPPTGPLVTPSTAPMAGASAVAAWGAMLITVATPTTPATRMAVTRSWPIR